MKTKTRKKLETFKVTGGRLTFGDPCYLDNPECPAKNGTWTALVIFSDEGDWGERVKRVIVHHDEFNPADEKLVSKTTKFGVDSGQAGVFDADAYGGYEFYDSCCKETLSARSYGYLPQGFVTSSGYGDGWYEAEVHKVSGKAVCIELSFIEN